MVQDNRPAEQKDWVAQQRALLASGHELHRDQSVQDWAQAMQGAYDDLNRQLDADPEAQTAIDPYAAENPAEFFAVTSEYFFSAPDLLHEAYPQVYQQLQRFYRQDPRARLSRLQAEHPHYRPDPA